MAPSWFELLSWVALGLGFASALGDIAGEWIVWATGWTIGTTALGPEYILDLPLAWTFGILFQYLAIAGMILGFATSWPVNRWLLRHGIKESMATV